MFRFPIRARFQDIDAVGILFFGRNFDYFHDAYVAFLSAIGLPLHEQLAEADHLLPLVHAEADFAAPLRFGDEAEVELTVATLGHSSYRIAYALRRSDGVLISSGTTVHVCVAKDGFAPRPLAQELRAALTPYLSADGPTSR
jgi:YbgC/YbaW family acyl-CoA thioester hydrolase